MQIQSSSVFDTILTSLACASVSLPLRTSSAGSTFSPTVGKCEYRQPSGPRQPSRLNLMCTHVSARIGQPSRFATTRDCAPPLGCDAKLDEPAPARWLRWGSSLRSACVSWPLQRTCGGCPGKRGRGWNGRKNGRGSGDRWRGSRCAAWESNGPSVRGLKRPDGRRMQERGRAACRYGSGPGESVGLRSKIVWKAEW